MLLSSSNKTFISPKIFCGVVSTKFNGPQSLVFTLQYKSNPEEKKERLPLELSCGSIAVRPKILRWSGLPKFKM